MQDLLHPSGNSGMFVFSEAVIERGWLLRLLMLLITAMSFKTHPVKCPPHQVFGEVGLSATSDVR